MAPRKKLGELLLEEKLIDDFQLSSALSHQKKWGGRLGNNLVALGFLTERQLLDFMARKFNLQKIDVLTQKIDPRVLEKIPKEMAVKHGVMPVRIDQEGPASFLVVAMFDPTNLMAIDEIRFKAGMNIRPVLAAQSQIVKAIQSSYRGVIMDDRAILMDTPVASDKPAGPKMGQDFVVYGMKTSAEKDIKGLAGEPGNMLRALVDLLIEKNVLTEQELKTKMSEPRKRQTTP